MIHRLLLVLAVSVALPAAASAQRVVVRTGHHGRHGATVVVAPNQNSVVVVNPPGPGNRTVVRTNRRGNTVINTPGPGRVVIRR